MIKGLIISVTSFIQSIWIVFLSFIISSIISRIFNITNDLCIHWVFVITLSAISSYVIYKNIKEAIKLRKGGINK